MHDVLQSVQNKLGTKLAVHKINSSAACYLKLIRLIRLNCLWLLLCFNLILRRKGCTENHRWADNGIHCTLLKCIDLVSESNFIVHYLRIFFTVLHFGLYCAHLSAFRMVLLLVFSFFFGLVMWTTLTCIFAWKVQLSLAEKHILCECTFLGWLKKLHRVFI